MPESVIFTTYGLPIAQGSKNPWGGESAKGLKMWRQEVASEARSAMNGRELWHGPVVLRATFTFLRPKSHYGTGRNAGIVKPSAPGWKPSAPDLDKLVRALGDALSGVVFHDDAQIVDLAVTKIWGQTPGVFCEVRSLS